MPSWSSQSCCSCIVCSGATKSLKRQHTRWIKIPAASYLIRASRRTRWRNWAKVGWPFERHFYHEQPRVWNSWLLSSLCTPDDLKWIRKFVAIDSVIDPKTGKEYEHLELGDLPVSTLDLAESPSDSDRPKLRVLLRGLNNSTNVMFYGRAE